MGMPRRVHKLLRGGEAAAWLGGRCSNQGLPVARSQRLARGLTGKPCWRTCRSARPARRSIISTLEDRTAQGVERLQAGHGLGRTLRSNADQERLDEAERCRM